MLLKTFARVSLALFLAFSLDLFARTSSEIREEKMLSFSLNSGSSGILFMEMGPSVEFFVKPWFAAGFSYRYNFINPGIDLDKGEMFQGASEAKQIFEFIKEGSHHYFSLDAKFYTGNSFYLKTGIAYDSMTFEDGITSAYVSSSAFMLPIAIGNTWQWKMINFGVEWIGARIPLGTSLSAGVENLGSINIEDEQFKDAFSAIHILKGVTLFTFSLGVAI